ncbi:MAG TPA: XRE family transcriptional regulator [Streptosporangiaceae bacterium]
MTDTETGRQVRPLAASPYRPSQEASQFAAPAPGEDDLNEALRIGTRLRRARLRRKLSLDELAKATGLSKGFISQLERDMTAASVASLLKLCSAVGITVGSLFEPSDAVLIRDDTAPFINFGGSGLRERLLTPRGSGELQLIRSEIAPRGGSGEEPYSLDAKAEVVHVLQGELVITLDDDVYGLHAGDTLTFSPTQSHTWHNPSNTDKTIVFWVLASAW